VLVDTHCHLGLLERAPEEVVAEARAEGVGHLVDVGIDLDSSRRAAANAARLEHVSATAGVHPHDAVAVDDRVLGELRALLADERVVAAGETGLDYYRDHSPRDVQRAAFAAHVRLARELDKALVVHCREAFADVLAILDGEGAPERVVFHCFTGDAASARAYLDLGLHISVSGIATFKTAEPIRDAVRVTPRDRLLVETDSPFLAPQTVRGRDNSPANVVEVIREIANVRGTTFESVRDATSANVRAIFQRLR